MNVCMYASMYVCICIKSMNGCMYVFVYMHVCMYICMYVYICMWYVCIYVCMYICMYNVCPQKSGMVEFLDFALIKWLGFSLLKSHIKFGWELDFMSYLSCTVIFGLCHYFVITLSLENVLSIIMAPSFTKFGWKLDFMRNFLWNVIFVICNWIGYLASKPWKSGKCRKLQSIRNYS